MILHCPSCDRDCSPPATHVLVYARETPAGYAPMRTDMPCQCGALPVWMIPVGRILDWLRGAW
jgi:hypothetical protein